MSGPKTRPFIQCDVFSATPTKGNGLAVVLDGTGLTDAQMQGFAAWTNLAETTFLLPPRDPAADYRLRIFTVSHEMPFAGHPTLGSCAAWLHLGNTPKTPGKVIQECNVGLVEIDQTGAHPAFVAPPTKIAPMPATTRAELTAALGLDPSAVVTGTMLNNGPAWEVLELNSADAVLAVDPGAARWAQQRAIGLIGPYAPGTGPDYEVRMLAISDRIIEDPITGSLNAALAHWLHDHGRLTGGLLIHQGTKINREGRVYMSVDRDRILIGGQTNILIEGSVTL